MRRAAGRVWEQEREQRREREQSRELSGPWREGDGGMESMFEAGEGWAWGNIGVHRWSR